MSTWWLPLLALLVCSSASVSTQLTQGKEELQLHSLDTRWVKYLTLLHRLTHAYRNLLQFEDTIVRSLQGIQKAGIIGNIPWYELQTYYYASAVVSPSVRTICEVGFGAGHSTVLYLSMNPLAHVYTFDFFPRNASYGNVMPEQYTYVQAAVKFIDAKFAEGHWTRVVGDSNDTITQFALANPSVTCDFISIDGSHTSPHILYDILHFKQMSTPATRVILDDYNDGNVVKDADQAVSMNLVTKYDCGVRAETYTNADFSGDGRTYPKEFCELRFKHTK